MQPAPATEDLSAYLEPGPTVQSDDPRVAAFAREAGAAEGSPRESAIAIYYAVRDEIRYDPYSADLTVEGLRATQTLATRRGWCNSKAILMAACCRAVGVPARLGYADVRNHLSTERMRRRMQTDVFYWHCYTDVHLEGGWVKATPAFNIELCEKFGLKPLEFDGVEDSIYHPFDVAGNRHMEYVRYRGEHAEPPIARMLETFQREYPHWRDRTSEPAADFEADVSREIGHG